MPIDKKLYKNKIIIFLDILGIKNFTFEKSDETLCGIYEGIKNLVEMNFSKTIQDSLTVVNHPLLPNAGLDLSKSDIEVSISVLSDTILVSFSKKYIFLLPIFLRFTRAISMALLHKNLLTSGSIVYGKIHHNQNDSIIFGKGLVNAYCQAPKT